MGSSAKGFRSMNDKSVSRRRFGLGVVEHAKPNRHCEAVGLCGGLDELEAYLGMKATECLDALQQQIWFIHTCRGASSAYNTSRCLPNHGPFRFGSVPLRCANHGRTASSALARCQPRR